MLGMVHGPDFAMVVLIELNHALIHGLAKLSPIYIAVSIIVVLVLLVQIWLRLNTQVIRFKVVVPPHSCIDRTITSAEFS